MRLIDSVEVRNFRSLRRSNLQDLEEYSPIIGPNGTGKSNVLRALSLFFNGYLDEARAELDLRRDFPDTLSNTKRRVVVRVSVDPSRGYAVRDSGKELARAGIKESLVVERAWSYVGGTTQVGEEPLRFGPDTDNLREATLAELADVLTLIRSIEFRYIPNHVRPADFLRSELVPLQQTIVRRVRGTKEYKSGGMKGTMAALRRVADELLRHASDDIAAGTKQLRGVGAEVPSDFSELAFQLVVNAVSSTGASQAPELQGSGTQTFMLLHLLDVVDRSLRGQGFGWRQSSIWAFEEPESFLHAGLRARFATDLRNFARDPRRQVIATTHQDEFVRTADWAWLASLPDTGTAFERLPSKDALQRSTRLLITTYRHPLQAIAAEPLLLVEGKTDALYLRRALAAEGVRPRWRLASMDDIDDMVGGGDAVVAWLRANQSVLRSRPDAAPVFLLRDWEEKSLPKFQGALAAHAWSQAFQCPTTLANPSLDESFVGIERFLSTTFVEPLLTGKLLVPAVGGPYSIKRPDLESAKPNLAAAFGSGSVDPGKHLRDLARWLDTQVAAAMAKIPAEAFS